MDDSYSLIESAPGRHTGTVDATHVAVRSAGQAPYVSLVAIGQAQDDSGRSAG
jgi:hypothetical protein